MIFTRDRLPAHLKQLEPNSAVGLDMREGQLVEPRQQQLHVRQKRFEGAYVMVTQSSVQTGIQTRLLGVQHYGRGLHIVVWQGLCGKQMKR